MSTTEKKNIPAMALTGLIAIALTASAIAKLAGNEMIMANMSKVGLGHIMKVVGVTELIFTGLFLFPKTRKLGFLFLCAHLGGAAATELAEHAFPVALILQAILWSAMFAWDKKMFFADLRQP